MTGLRSSVGWQLFAGMAFFAACFSLPDASPAYGQVSIIQAGPAATDDSAAGEAPQPESNPAEAARITAMRLATARQQNGEASMAYAFALRSHARSLAGLAKYDDAEALARKALAIVTAVRGPADIQALVSRTQLGFIITRAGRFAEGEPLLRQACRALQARAGPDAPPVLECETNLAINLIGQSRYHEAHGLLRQIVAIRSKLSGPRDPVVLAAKLQLGRVMRAEGSLGQAEAILRDVVEAQRVTVGDRNHQTLDAIGELGDVLVSEHRGDEAEPLYRLSLKYRSELYGERHPETLLAMDTLARDLAMIGHVREAEPLIRQALTAQIQILGETHPQTLTSMNTLAYVLRMEGQPNAAEGVMRHSLDLRRRTLGPDNATTLNTVAALAMDIAAQGRRSEAEQLLEQAIAGHRRIHNAGRVGLDAALVQLGGVRLAQPDRAPLAVEPLREAVAALRERRANASYAPRTDIELGRETVTQAGAYRLLADAAWAAAQAQPDQLVALREEAFLALQDAMAGTVTQSFALAAARAAARAAGADIGALADQRQELADRWRAIADREIATIGNPVSASMDSANPGSGSPPNAGPEPVADMAGLVRQINAIDAQLQSRAPGYFALTRPEAVPLAAAQALLGPNEAVLIVVPSLHGTHVMALTHDRLVWHKSDLTHHEIVAMVGNLRSELDPDAVARNNRSFSRQLAFRLYRELVAPLEPALAGKKQLFIAADGALASLPFEVLVTVPATGSDDDAAAMRATQWFGDAHALVQLPSLQTLQFLRAMRRGQTGPFAGFQGFGDPRLGTGGSTRGGAKDQSGAVASVAQLPSLPGTADELRRMANALGAPASAVHLEEADTKTAVQSMDLSHARILAFATHGLLPGELRGVDEPGLVFTPPAAPNPDDDGFLSTSDITQLKLDADLVILSACNSGSGEGENAPPLSGLARSFFYAGARVLLVSHWPVYDDVAPRITVELIAARRANPQLSLAEALQTAIRKIREDQDDPSLAFPSAWAPFVIVGDWRPF